jgi:hypothetical protein
VETLEGRTLLSSWVEQGPGPILNGDVEGMVAQHGSVAGAVEALAPEPGNPDVLYAGSVNGGIWKTTDATAAAPTWVPLTDHMPSLSISDLAFSPADPTHRTLYAATGNFSNGFDGGPGAGIYRTTDGGATWNVLGREVFGQRRIRNIVPTALDGGRVLLAGSRADPATQTGGGVYRSADGGATWTLVSGTGGLATGPVSFLTGDPGDPRRFYATIQESAGTNIYRSDDGGLTWATKVAGLSGIAEPFTRIELAIHDDPGHNVIYAAVMTPPSETSVPGFLSGRLSGLFRSTDLGDHWTPMDLPGDADGGIFLRGQTGVNFAMAADPTDPDVVYVSGDQEIGPFPMANGTTSPVDRSFRGDASRPPGLQWTPLDGYGAGGTAPHEDSRDFKFDARGDLLLASDGGVFRLLNPNNAPGAGPRHWVAAVGNLGTAELYSVAYDSLNHAILAGAQDNGSVEQFGPIWAQFISRDGVGVAVDQTSIPGSSIHYYEEDLGSFFVRATFDGAHRSINSQFLGLVINGTGGKRLLYDIDDTNDFHLPFALNSVDPTRMLIGTQSLYESFDRGDHLDPLVSGANIGQVTALAYGGRLRHVANPDVAYVGTEGPAKILLRTAAGGAFRPLSAYRGDVPLDIILDPGDWRRAYVVDKNNHVWATSSAGRSWRNVTGNLKRLMPSPKVANGAPSLRTAAIIDRGPGPGRQTVIVGGFGGVFALRNPASPGSRPGWVKLGHGLPNVVVTDVLYDAKDDVVIAGTLGRGAWSLRHPRRFLRETRA